MRNAENKVIEVILKVGRKFSSATMLAFAIEQFGLFDGVVYWDEKGLHLIPWREDENEPAIPFCRINTVTGIEYFGACYYGATWECKLCSYSGSYIFLIFDHKTGDIVNIIPDDKKGNDFWESDDPEERMQEIEDLIKEEKQ